MGFTNASDYGAVPDTGADMTQKINDAFSLAPPRSTLFFAPGTYKVVSGRIAASNPVNVWAYGAIFDFKNSTLAPESLSQPNFQSANKWDFTPGFSAAAGYAQYTHVSGSGMLTQTRVNQATPVEANRPYQLAYTVSAAAGTISAEITAGIATSPVALDLTNGTHTVSFTTNANPGDFVILASSSPGGTFRLDDLSLQQELESLKNPSFASLSGWERSGDFELSIGSAQYSHVTGAGTLKQTVVNLAIPIQGSKRYEFTYTVSHADGPVSAALQAGMAAGSFPLNLRNGTHTVNFTTPASPGDFVIAAASSPGGTFELTNLSLTTEGYAIRWGFPNPQTHIRLTFQGLQIVRTPNNTTLETGRKYTAFDWFSIVQCTVQDCDAREFKTGHFVHGEVSGSRGCYANNFFNLSTWNCAKGIRVATERDTPGQGTPFGWANGNGFRGGRLALDALALTDPATGIAISIESDLYNPNNLQFMGVDLSTAWGRKIYCEGQNNYWLFCRYENLSSTGYEIEFTPGVYGGSGQKNTVAWGHLLSTVAVLADATIANQKIDSALMNLGAVAIDSAASVLLFKDAAGNAVNSFYADATDSDKLSVEKGFVANQSGSASDTRIEGIGEPNLLFAKAATARLGIGTAAPLVRAHITGPHVLGVGTLAVVNSSDNAYLTLDHGPSSNGGLQMKMGGAQRALIDHVAASDYLRMYAYGSPGGEVLIVPIGTGWVGLPHGTVPSKPTDLPASELDLYDGRISQMGWHRIATVGTGDHTTSKEVVIGVRQVPKTVYLAASDRAVAGRILIIKDETGTAGTQNQEIRIDALGAKINGSTSQKIIQKNYGYVALYSDGTDWFTIGQDIA